MEASHSHHQSNVVKSEFPNTQALLSVMRNGRKSEISATVDQVVGGIWSKWNDEVGVWKYMLYMLEVQTVDVLDI